MNLKKLFIITHIKAASKHKEKASLTIEAAMVLPIVIYAVLMLVSIIIYYGIEMRMQVALYNTTQNISKYYYGYEVIKTNKNINLEKMEEDNIYNKIVAQGIEVGLAKSLVLMELGEDFLDTPFIKDGISGIHFYYSDLVNNEGNIDVVVSYNLCSPFDIFGFGNISVTQRSCIRAYKGDKSIAYEEEKEEETYVYITINGKVYHTKEDCTYIKISVDKVSYEEAKAKRNDSGAKYYACSKCTKLKDKEDVFYITKYGNRYHKDRNCYELRRGIIKVPLKDVEGRALCSKCKGQ